MAALLKFFERHLLQNRKSDWAKTWWEASQWHRDSELLKSFRSDSQDSRQGAILKFFKWYLRPNHKSDWAETWWEALEHYIQNCYNSSVPISKMVAILKFFIRHLPNRRSDWAKTWWEASEWHRDSELLKLFRSDIQVGRHSSHIGILQTTSPPKP